MKPLNLVLEEMYESIQKWPEWKKNIFGNAFPGRQKELRKKVFKELEDQYQLGGYTMDNTNCYGEVYPDGPRKKDISNTYYLAVLIVRQFLMKNIKGREDIPKSFSGGTYMGDIPIGEEYDDLPSDLYHLRYADEWLKTKRSQKGGY